MSLDHSKDRGSVKPIAARLTLQANAGHRGAFLEVSSSSARPCRPTARWHPPSRDKSRLCLSVALVRVSVPRFDDVYR